MPTTTTRVKHLWHLYIYILPIYDPAPIEPNNNNNNNNNNNVNKIKMGNEILMKIVIEKQVNRSIYIC